MKAVELRIVFEDDEGKTYLKTYKSGDPRIATRVLDAVRDVFWEYTHDGSACMSSEGPVLRKVTEVEGTYEHDCEGDWIMPKPLTYESESAHMESIVPREPQEFVREERTPTSVKRFTALYRFRFDVTAVPVKP